MADFNLRSDSVNVEQIMEQIRARIREKRGVDYTAEQIRELAAVKLQKFLDPRGVRSDLLDEFRKAQPPYTSPDLPNYAFEENTLFDSHRVVLRLIRRLLRPIVKLFFNPNPLIQALNIQARLNTMMAEREARREASQRAAESLYYELIHNLVLEATRLGIEVKNLTMRVESLSSRLEFNERRARALESAVVYKPTLDDVGVGAKSGREPRGQYGQPGQQSERIPQGQPSPQGQQIQQPEPSSQVPPGGPKLPGDRGRPGEGPGQRSRRRRRRRGRRGGEPAATVMAAPPPTPANTPAASVAGTPGPSPAAPGHGGSPAGGADTHSATAETLERAPGSQSHASEGGEASNADRTDSVLPDDSK
jgi:hypothetical protein